MAVCWHIPFLLMPRGSDADLSRCRGWPHAAAGYKPLFVVPRTLHQRVQTHLRPDTLKHPHVTSAHIRRALAFLRAVTVIHESCICAEISICNCDLDRWYHFDDISRRNGKRITWVWLMPGITDGNGKWRAAAISILSECCAVGCRLRAGLRRWRAVAELASGWCCRENSPDCTLPFP